MILDPVVGILITASVAVLFASAAAHKLKDLARFEEIFSAYGMIPAIVPARISRVIPALELLVAVGLVSSLARPHAVVLAIVLLLAYGVAIGVNLARGRRDLACGCGGPNERRPIAAWMVWRNIMIAAAAAAVLAPWTARPLSMTDGVTIVFGLLTVALIYLCTDQLFGTAPRTAQLRGSR